MADFLTRSGEFSYITLALLSFLLGVLASNISDALRRRREKTRLIDLFVDDIRRNWKEVESLGWAPSEPVFVRLRFTLKGVDDLLFSGVPEYLFEVYNLKFFETEGLKLAQLLPAKPRKALWDAYSLMRDAEAVRKVLNEIDPQDKDYSSYRKLFAELARRLERQLILVEEVLWRERTWWRKLTNHGEQQKPTTEPSAVSPNPAAPADRKAPLSGPEQQNPLGDPVSVRLLCNFLRRGGPP